MYIFVSVTKNGRNRFTFFTQVFARILLRVNRSVYVQVATYKKNKQTKAKIKP